MENRSEVGDGTGRTRAPFITPSLGNALGYCLPMAVLPLVAAAVLYGGWWIAGPAVFFILADSLDAMSGIEERNMDPRGTPESELLWHKLATWIWVALYVATLVFALWQILVAGHLAAWEALLLALVLGNVARLALNAGHDLIHRRSVWERRMGEFLQASVSFPQETTEHIYVHHAHVCTPKDPMSAPKGQSFWQYFPRSITASLTDSWRFERDRLARRRLPVWHHTNPFWRYVLEAVAWYALAYWMGGAWGLLIFAIICAVAIFQLRVVDYLQHYGLQRIRLPNGRFERVQPRHSWSAAFKLSDWLYYNVQRHSDHHAWAGRLYPLLQHSGPEQAPQLPGSYSVVSNLAMFPSRWFRTMDPLVDEWRARFYPEIDDWSAYDSAAFAARPDSYEEIAEILASAPRLGAWINRAPELLDSLREREFTNLDLPRGFGPDPEFEAIARRGLARVYWTHELGVSEMREQIAEHPVQGVREAVEVARNWSNDKAFQLGVHTMRGNLSPMEAGAALCNVAEASVAATLTTVEENVVRRSIEGGVAAVVFGDLAAGEVSHGAELDILLVYDGGDARHMEALCRRFLAGLRALSRESLLFAPLPQDSRERTIGSLADLVERYRRPDSASELLQLIRARCVFECGQPGIHGRFDRALREILADRTVRAALIVELRNAPRAEAGPGLSSFEDMPGGLKDVERAAQFLWLTDDAVGDPSIPPPDAASVFERAGGSGMITGEAAQRLAGAARMWRNLRGAVRLEAEDGFAAEAAGSAVKAVIAQACGMDDFEALDQAVHEMGEAAAACLDELYGGCPEAGAEPAA